MFEYNDFYNIIMQFIDDLFILFLNCCFIGKGSECGIDASMCWRILARFFFIHLKIPYFCFLGRHRSSLKPSTHIFIFNFYNYIHVYI